MKNFGSLFLVALLPLLGCGTSTTTNPMDLEMDSTPPAVSITDPTDGSTGVSTDTKVRAAFSKTMDAATLTAATFTLTQAGTSVPAAVSYVGMTATLVPNGILTANSLFTATITSGAEDILGYALVDDYVWSFTTTGKPTIDVIRPTITFVNPAENAAAVPINAKISAIFSEAMDAKTLSAATFTLMQGSTPILGTVSYTDLMATFTPKNTLAKGTAFTATVMMEAADLAGNTLASDTSWSFETNQLMGESPVNLGAASSFAILAFNTVTNVITVGTIVTGDLGISPGAALTGFPPGQVIGKIHAGDPIAAFAKADLFDAYNDAAGRPGGATLPADMSGLTFTPGLYKSATSLMLATGNVKLDAQGNADAVFVFQIGSTLTTIANTHVILTGGAKANNIYWAVGSSATLGTNSSFKGTILAASAITIAHGASLEGRLLAQGAAITLDENSITVPTL